MNQAPQTFPAAPDEARTIAAEAYVYAYAPLFNYKTLFQQTQDSAFPGYIGGFGKFRHYARGFRRGHRHRDPLYSENTRRPYDNGGSDVRSANLDNTLEDLRYNDDGSVDLYIGPHAPAGYEQNFMKTVGDDGWFVYFRLYAPLQPFFDKSFSLNDFEMID